MFQNGKSQAVRLPKEFRLNGERVYVKRVGNAVALLPYNAPWQSLVDSLSLFSDDYLRTRKQPPTQKRGKTFARNIFWIPTSALHSSGRGLLASSSA